MLSRLPTLLLTWSNLGNGAVGILFRLERLLVVDEMLLRLLAAVVLLLLLLFAVEAAEGERGAAELIGMYRFDFVCMLASGKEKWEE